jgi:MFS family permease
VRESCSGCCSLFIHLASLSARQLWARFLIVSGANQCWLISLSITTLCYAVISTALNLASFVLLSAALVIAGLAEANIVIAQSAIADVVPADQRNRFFGYIYMSVSAAYIVGPLGGGKLADHELVSWFNYATPFWTVMILLAIVTVVSAILFTETNPPEARHAVATWRRSPTWQASSRIDACVRCIGSTFSYTWRSSDLPLLSDVSGR